MVIALEAMVLCDVASRNWIDAARLHGAAGRLRGELAHRLRTELATRAASEHPSHGSSAS